MALITAQNDRACGVLLAAAAGDALGVPYEFGHPPGRKDVAEMKGGGLGGFAPGEWSDDTSMAVAIAEVASTGADLTSEASLDAVAKEFLRWLDSRPADIGVQTSVVLSASRRRLSAGDSGPARVMREEAASYAAQHAHSAGNGALMRTGPVALAHLDDRHTLASAARAIAELTHADPLAGDSCVLWCEAIRIAVLEGRIDVRAGLDLLPADRRNQWAAWLDDATDVDRDREDSVPGRRFTPNGFTVTALQAATAAIVSTPDGAPYPCLHLQDALHAAVRIGDDTDTVAAIAGALLGARWGASAVPWRWRRAVHGWPGKQGRDLVAYSALTVSGGRSDASGWPTVEDVVYDDGEAATEAVPHPYDSGVLLGTHASAGHQVDAVVAMCRVGPSQACFAGAAEVIESRLMDRQEAEANPNLGFVLYDTADAVRGLRGEDKRVLLHCVAAQQRTPSVAVAYAVLLGRSADDARRDVLAALPSTRGRGRVWEAAGSVIDIGDDPRYAYQSGDDHGGT